MTTLTEAQIAAYVDRAMRPDETPLVPALPAMPQGPMYLVLAAFGRLGEAYVEREPEKMNWAGTVYQLAVGEWADVRRVVEVDLANGRSADVTERALLAAQLVRDGAPLICCV